MAPQTQATKLKRSFLRRRKKQISPVPACVTVNVSKSRDGTTRGRTLPQSDSARTLTGQGWEYPDLGWGEYDESVFAMFSGRGAVRHCGHGLGDHHGDLGRSFRHAGARPLESARLGVAVSVR